VAFIFGHNNADDSGLRDAEQRRSKELHRRNA